jgi:hypothetical protein
MSGSLSIPNTFATASGTVSLSLLDADFSTVAGYVNTREISIGTAAARPAAAVAGRWYFASDTGLLYVDTGSAWVQVGNTGVASSVGSPRIDGFTAVNTPSAPTTKLDLAAGFVQLRNPTDGTVAVRTSTGTLTNDTGAAGSVANGRDQAGAFSASTDVHFYFIWNGVTLATLSSATAPPTGPTLPTGYTHWAYATGWRFSATSTLPVAYGRGAWVNYASSVWIIANGAATTERDINYASATTANCQRVMANVSFIVANGVSPQNNPQIKVLKETKYWGSNDASGVVNAHGVAATIILPNVNQSAAYQFANAPGAAEGLYFSISGYSVPNGDPS